MPQSIRVGVTVRLSMRGYCPNTDCSEDRHQFSLLTGQWNFPALLQRIARGLDRHVRFGSNASLS